MSDPRGTVTLLLHAHLPFIRHPEHRYHLEEHWLYEATHATYLPLYEVIDHLAGSETWPVGFEILEEAQRLVRWHYQWIVVHDFLERIVSRDVLRDVLRPGAKGAAPTVHRRVFTWVDEPLIPVEFSGAAFRFAHKQAKAPASIAEGDIAELVKHFGEELTIDVIWWSSRCHYMTRVADAFQLPLERENVFEGLFTKKK